MPRNRATARKTPMMATYSPVLFAKMLRIGFGKLPARGPIGPVGAGADATRELMTVIESAFDDPPTLTFTARSSDFVVVTVPVYFTTYCARISLATCVN